VARNYYPFGEEIGTPTASNTYKFASTYRDSSSGLDYAVNRYYASGIGRFLSVDPVVGRATRPQSWNRYTYVRNDPVNHRDPKGLRGDDDDDDPEEADDWTGFIANAATPGSGGTGGTSPGRVLTPNSTTPRMPSFTGKRLTQSGT
jgi:RHS repeat-associated protein